MLANSGGLGNTYSEEEMEQQISRLLPKAYAALSRLVSKHTPRTLLEDITLYRYLNEILVSFDGFMFYPRVTLQKNALISSVCKINYFILKPTSVNYQ